MEDLPGEMGEVAADPGAFVHGIAGAAGRARVRVAEANFRVNEIADCLHDPRRRTGFRTATGEIRELVAVTTTPTSSSGSPKCRERNGVSRVARRSVGFRRRRVDAIGNAIVEDVVDPGEAGVDRDRCRASL